MFGVTVCMTSQIKTIPLNMLSYRYVYPTIDDVMLSTDSTNPLEKMSTCEM